MVLLRGIVQLWGLRHDYKRSGAGERSGGPRDIVGAVGYGYALRWRLSLLTAGGRLRRGYGHGYVPVVLGRRHGDWRCYGLYVPATFLRYSGHIHVLRRSYVERHRLRRGAECGGGSGCGFGPCCDAAAFGL